MPGINYNQVRRNKDGSLIEIRTKGQYEKFLKNNGLVSISPREQMSLKKPQDPNAQKRHEVVHRVFERAHKDGIEGKKIGNFMKEILQYGKKGG